MRTCKLKEEVREDFLEEEVKPAGQSDSYSP